MTTTELGEFIQDRIIQENLLDAQAEKLIVWAGDSREKLVAIMREAFRLQDEEEGK